MTKTTKSAEHKGKKIHFTIDLDDGSETSASSHQEVTKLFQDESTILDKLNLVYKKGEQNTEHGITAITVIDFQDEEQQKKALRLLTNYYSRIIWKVLPLLRQFGIYPRADVRYRTAQAVGELMCEMDFIRIKNEIIIPWAKSPLLEINANVGLAFSVVIKHEKFSENIKKLLKHWSTTSDPDLNRTALASSIQLCSTLPEESIEIVYRALNRKTTPWDYTMQTTLSSFILDELCENEHVVMVVDHLRKWIDDKSGKTLRLGAALSFLEVINLSYALAYETGRDKIIYIYQICLENRRLDGQGMVRTVALEKLRKWTEEAFGDDEKEAYIETLFMRLYMRSTTDRDKKRLIFNLKRWQKEDKENRFEFIIKSLIA